MQSKSENDDDFASESEGVRRIDSPLSKAFEKGRTRRCPDCWGNHQSRSLRENHFRTNTARLGRDDGAENSLFDLEHYKGQIEASHRMFQSVISTSDAAVKSLFLINGGGCVALLTIIGQLASHPGNSEAPAVMAVPLLTFGVGHGLATLPFAFSPLLRQPSTANGKS